MQSWQQNAAQHCAVPLLRLFTEEKMSAEPEMLPVFPAAAVHAHLSTNTPFSSTPGSFQRQYKALEQQIDNHKYTATIFFFLF